MTPSDGPSPRGQLRDAAAPPWIWVWTAFVLVFFSRTAWIRATGVIGTLRNEFPFRDGDGATAWLDWVFVVLLGVGGILASVAIVVVPIGLLALAGVRARHLKHGYGLDSAPLSTPITEAVEASLPGAAVWVSRRIYPAAIVLPTGLRRAAVALFSSFFVIWKRDQDAARLLLEHEAAHLRRGDAQLIGVGSIQRLVVLIMVAVFLFTAIGMIGMALRQEHYLSVARDENGTPPEPQPNAHAQPSMVGSQAQYLSFISMQNKITLSLEEARLKRLLVDLYSKHGEHERAAQHRLTEQDLALLAVDNWRLRGAAAWFLQIVGWLTWTIAQMVSLLVYLFAAIWIAELGADRQAVQVVSSANPLLRTLDSASGLNWRQRVGASFTHPPVWIRRWNARCSWQARGLLPLLLSFPMAIVASVAILAVGYLVLSGCITLSYLLYLDEPSSGTALSRLPELLSFAVDSHAKLFWICSAIILTWPWVAPYWERLFGGFTLLRAGERWPVYAAASAAVAVVPIAARLLFPPAA